MKRYEYVFIGILISLIVAGTLAGYFKINFIYVIIFGIVPAILFVVYVVVKDERHSIEGVSHEA